MTLQALIMLVLLQSSGDPTPRCSGLATEYGNKQVAAIQERLQRAGGQGERLEIVYRLYPLTEDETLLDDLPADVEPGSEASHAALLGALWTWRGSRGSFLTRIPAIRKGMRLLDRAKDMDPHNPYVMLIDGQALIFKPRIAGGSVEEALKTFRDLRTRLEENGECAVSIAEVDSWIWYCLDRLDSPEADAFRNQYLASNPPPLFRDFLHSPP